MSQNYNLFVIFTLNNYVIDYFYSKIWKTIAVFCQYLKSDIKFICNNYRSMDIREPKNFELLNFCLYLRPKQMGH